MCEKEKKRKMSVSLGVYEKKMREENEKKILRVKLHNLIVFESELSEKK